MNAFTLLLPCKGQEDCVGAAQLKAASPWRTHIIAERFYGEAIKRGIRYTRTRYVATMDADGQHQLRDVTALWRELQASHADMVIGRRPWTIRGCRPAMSQLLNLTASILAGQHIPDMGSGIRIFRRAIVLPLLDHLPDGFDFNASLTLALMLKGYEVLWVPTPYRPRTHGQSHVRWHDGLLTLHSLCRIKRQLGRS